MRILCITSGKLKSLMNRERFDLYEAMERQGAIIYDVDKNNTFKYDLIKLVNHIEKKYGKLSGIIFEEAVWSAKFKFKTIFKNADKITIPKATFLTDYWQQRRFLFKYIKQNDIKIIISTHEVSYPFIKKYLKNIEHILFIPFCIKKEQYKIKQLKYDIINAGDIHPMTPLRNQMYKILNKIKNINYLYINHPGKRYENKKAISGQKYIDNLCQSYFSVATTTEAKLSVRKYYEIMAAGCTIIGNETGLPEHELIRKNIIKVNLKNSDAKTIKIIEEAVKNKEKYRKKALELRKEIIKLADRENVSKKIFEFFNSQNLKVSILSNNQKIYYDYPQWILDLNGITKGILKKIGIKYKGLKAVK